jgi:hypothetical protein
LHSLEIEMHRFWVTKPPAAYQAKELMETDHLTPASPAQLKAIGQITDLLRTIIVRCASVKGSNNGRAEESPFQLFEMHPGIASLLGLNEGCWVMLELSGHSPTVIFEDRDLAQLKRRSVVELESAASALHHQLDNQTAFTLLTRQ